MFWNREGLSGRLIIIVSLFLIGAIHTLVFAVFEFPSNFLLGKAASYAFYCKIVLYAMAIGVSFSHQSICRTFGLKKTLVVGLLFNSFGLVTLWINKYLGGLVPLVFLDMFFFGVALTSVINVLITYIVLELPKAVGVGIITLFAAFNAGVMLAPLTIDIFHRSPFPEGIYIFLLLLLLFAARFVAKHFFEPPYPPHLRHLRKGTLIWRDLHYRLGLFLLAVIFYGLTETTFNLWGFVKIASQIGESIANETISLLWLFLIIGQLVLLIPLYFFPSRRIFYFNIVALICDLFFFSRQTHLAGFITALMIGGFFSSVIFPILLSMIEKELIQFGKKKEILPYIETSVSVLMAGYFIGVGTIDLWVETADKTVIPVTPFYLGMCFIAATGLIGAFLNLTAHHHRK